MSPAHTSIPGPIPTLSDGVVTLREFGIDDADALVQNSNDPELARWTSLPQPYERSHALAWLALIEQGRADGNRYQFAIEHDARLVGSVNLRPRSGGLAELGFQLSAPSRGQGLMTRALRLAIPWGFDQAGIEVLHWRSQVGNWPSRRVAWAVGFQVGTPVPGLLEHRGRRVDGWIAGLRATDPLEPAHAWLDPVTIMGRGVNLRAHRDQDVPRMVEASRDPRTQYWLRQLPEDYSAENARERLYRIENEQAGGRALFWAFADPTDDRFLGELIVAVRAAEEGQGEVGYWAHPEARGRGVTTEAVRLAVRHALLPVADGGLGLTRMLLKAAAGNLGSQRVAEKNGFTRSGLDRGAEQLRDGTIVDDLRFDLLADELPAVR